MGLETTRIAGVYLTRPEPVLDERGSFTRTFSAQEFVEAGLDPTIAHCSLSNNTERATLRGMHLQRAPHGETKLIRCTRGRIFDVAVDVRPGSVTFGEWIGFQLDESDALAVVLEPGIAHGFVTLTPHSEVSYQISAPYHPESAIGFRWDDPEVGIDWPVHPTLVSQRDRALPLLAELSSRTTT